MSTSFLRGIAVMGAASEKPTVESVKARLDALDAETRELEERAKKLNTPPTRKQGTVDQEKRKATALTRAKNLAPKIDTLLKARATIVEGMTTLRKAGTEIGRFSTLDISLMRANISRIEQVMEYGRKLTNESLEPFDNRQRERVALFLVQAVDVLKDVSDLATQSVIRNSIRGLLEDFAESVRKILEEVARIAPMVVPGSGTLLAVLAVTAIGLGIGISIAK